MSLANAGSPHPILLPASKITYFSNLPDWIPENTVKLLIRVLAAINFRRALDPVAIGGRRLLEATAPA